MEDCYKEDIFIVCKETNFNNEEEFEVYDVGFIDKDNLSIPHLQLRERYNYNLKYYAILESNLGNKDYIINLIKKGINSILYTYV